MENATDVYMDATPNELMVDDTGMKRILSKEGGITFMKWADVPPPVLKVEKEETSTNDNGQCDNTKS